MPSIIVITACGATLLFLVVRSYFRYTRHVARLQPTLPPGPIPLPWIGTESAIRGLNSDAKLTLSSLARYGEMATVWLARSPLLVVNSPRVAHDLMHTMSADTSDRPLTVHYRAKLLPWSLVLAPYGEQFLRLRKLYHRLLGFQGSLVFQVHSENESLFMMKALADDPDIAHSECDRYGFNLMMRAIYGVHYGSDDGNMVHETFSLWEKMFCYFQPGSLIIDYFPSLLEIPQWSQMWYWIFRGLKRQERGLHIEHLRQISSYYPHLSNEKSPVEPAEPPFAAHILQVTAEMDIGEQAIIDILSMLLGAGADTISAYMHQFLKTMALHPEVVARAQAELDAVVGTDRLPCWDDREQLPYLRAVIKEVHRWAPFADAGIPHATKKPMSYAGYEIPEGTTLLPNIPSMMRSPERYVDPDRFDPDRFLGDDLDSAASARSADWEKRDHIHFGWGRRLCPGIHVADICLFTAVSRILWGFTIRPRRGEPVLMDDYTKGLLKKALPFRLDFISRGERHREAVTQGLASCSMRHEKPVP